MPDVRYRVYPTLLNEFGKYLNSPTQEAKRSLLNRINRVSDFDEETLRKFKKGISFEEAIVKNKSHNFDPKIIEEAQNLLPTLKILQVPLKFVFENIQFYGYADVVGEGRVIDIKTTSSYKPLKFQFNFQMLYLYALKDKGCLQMDYLIYDFQKIYVESYFLSTFNFNPMLDQMTLFANFLEENRSLIKDRKIFVENDTDGLF